MKLQRLRNGHIIVIADTEKTENLKRTSLKGCPFTGYTAADLLADLIGMYNWKMEVGKAYTIEQFLDLCNDAHATAYKALFA